MFFKPSAIFFSTISTCSTFFISLNTIDHSIRKTASCALLTDHELISLGSINVFAAVRSILILKKNCSHLLGVRRCWCRQCLYQTASSFIRQLKTLEPRTCRSIVQKSSRIIGLVKFFSFIIVLYALNNYFHALWLSSVLKLYILGGLLNYIVL